MMKANELMVRVGTKKGFEIVREGGAFDNAYATSKTRRGRVQGHYGDIAPTLTCQTTILYFENKMKETPIRRFTPREVFRFMGVSDTDIDKILATGMGVVDCSMLAGNSIVVDVLAGIFKNLFINNNGKRDDTLF